MGVLSGLQWPANTYNEGGCVYDLVEETIDDVQVCKTIGGKDASCAAATQDEKFIIGEASDDSLWWFMSMVSLVGFGIA